MNTYEDELARRLAIIEDPMHEDAARHNLPRRDILILASVAAVVVIVMWLWGAPA